MNPNDYSDGVINEVIEAMDERTATEREADEQATLARTVIEAEAAGESTGLSEPDLDALKAAAADLVVAVKENEEFRQVPNRDQIRRHSNGFNSIQSSRSRIRRSRHRIRKQHSE